jgi:hypothetical protein
VCRYIGKGEIIYYLNDYNGSSLGVVDYLFERIKRETRSKSIQQAGYLVVKGLLKKKGDGDALFKHLDALFDIPQAQAKPQKSEDELIDEFSNYVKGA